jgi:hypothetical protein
VRIFKRKPLGTLSIGAASAVGALTILALLWLLVGVQPKAKAALGEIYGAETKAKAEKAFDLFVKTYQAKYPEATEWVISRASPTTAFYELGIRGWLAAPWAP